jgi:hypothetical protein
MFKLLNGRTSFYQWDTDQKLIIDTDIPDYQVHFQDINNDVCLIKNPYTLDNHTVVDVPNVLLQSNMPIIVWCYVLDENGYYTIKSKTFAVIYRQKPSDYVYTETEVLSFNSKLDKNIGAENAGKTLIVDNDGNITFGEASGGGNSLPITYVKSLDRTNPQELCKMEAGIYILYGYFTPYSGSGRNITYDNRLAICDVNTKDGTRYFQIFSPYKNTVLYLVVTESTYERTDTELSGIVTKVDTSLSNSSTYPLQNKVITEALTSLENRIAALEGGKRT